MNDFIITTTNLTKQYGNQKSVNSVNIHVRKGKIYGLLGRNGAGKTTIMKILLGLTDPTIGSVEIMGNLLKGNEKNILPKIGSLVESPGFYPNLTGTENLNIFAILRKVKSKKVIKEALTLVGLPYKDKKLFSEYSLGMKQRLAIALAVMHNPDILILDEPINGLDPIGISEIRHFIKELSLLKGKTIIISSHILSEIELLADDIGIIDNGVLLEEGSLEELRERSEQYIKYIVSDTRRTYNIFGKILEPDKIKIIDDKEIKLYNTRLDTHKINSTLIEQGIGIYEVYIYEASLEDYFKKVTGGEGIA